MKTYNRVRFSLSAFRFSRCLLGLAAAAGCLLLTVWPSQATTFTWTNLLVSGSASGNWPEQTNWDTTLPTTTGDVADFSTLNTTADSAIPLVVSQSINSLVFGDADTSSAAGWTLSAGNTLSLTLGGSNPTITVNALGSGKGATNNLVMAGSSFVKAGSGSLTLGGSAANTFAGTTVVTNGTLVLNKSDNIVAIPGDLVVASGASVVTLKKSQLAGTANLTVNGTFDTSGKMLVVNSMTVDSNAQILGSSSSVYITNATTFDVRSGSINPNLAGPAGMTKTTDGTVVLFGAGANIFTGPTLVSAGILDLNHGGTGQGLASTLVAITNSSVLRLLHDTEINPAATVTVAGATFELAAHNETVSTVILDNGGSILNSNNTSKTLTITTNMDFRSGLCASKLGGASVMVKSTPGTVILTMDNANSGGVLISGGILQLGDGSSVNRGQFGTGPVTNNAAIVLNHYGSFTIVNAISGSGSLTNLGGSPSLTADNSYSGGTKVSGGTLFINNTTGSGTGSGAVIVDNATLAGNGSIGGAVAIHSGSTLAPGNSAIGTLTISGNLTLDANSTSTFEVNGTTPANDTVALGSSVTYGGVLNIAASGTFTAGQQFVLFSGAGATSASNFASLVGSPGANKAFNFTNGVLSVVSTVIPQPTLNFSQSGSTLTFSWTDAGFKLQSQTNSTGLGTNWFHYPDTSNPVDVTIDPANPAVFFRLSN